MYFSSYNFIGFKPQQEVIEKISLHNGHIEFDAKIDSEWSKNIRFYNVICINFCFIPVLFTLYSNFISFCMLQWHVSHVDFQHNTLIIIDNGHPCQIIFSPTIFHMKAAPQIFNGKFKGRGNVSIACNNMVFSFHIHFSI